MTNVYDILAERGFLKQCSHPEELRELLGKEKVAFYIGYDPTADSLHIGHYVALMTMAHMQRAGHLPIVLLGGGTACIGDPSGKSDMRRMMTTEEIDHNAACFQKQMARLIDFSDGKAIIANNADWLRGLNFLDFMRDIGTQYSVNRMLTFECYKQRMEKGLTFFEMGYMLLQGYDFLYQYEKYGVRLQLGGNDQWGNMTTGTELIHRTLGNDAECFCLTCPLITKADGKKFGKTESGNIWLDRNRTTPYAFYQFWLNVSDDDAEKYIKIFTDLDKETIDALVEEHNQDPGRRVLQKRLAEEVTIMVHSQEDLDMAIAASNILFGKATKENLAQLDEATLNDVFANVPHYDLDKNLLGGTAVDLFNQEGMQIFPSKSEMRKLVKGGGVSLNKEKLAAFDQVVTADDLIDGKYLLVQKGKKNYFLITVK